MAQGFVTGYQQLENGAHQQQENKPSWRYQSCQCCPYGYHIDLDFVRYCETVKEHADYTGTMNKRRERRRQRQSMEMLLGLTIPAPIPPFATLPRTAEHSQKSSESPNLSRSYSSCLQTDLVEDALADVVTDFERTLERSNNSSSSNSAFHLADRTLYRVSSNSSVSSGSICGTWSGSPRVTAVPTTTTTGTYSTTSNVNGFIGDFDSDTLTKGSNAGILKNIRKQMALGLERIRELEEQVKLIPALQVQVSVLKDEKRKLLEQMKDQWSDGNDSVSSKHATDGAQKWVTVAARRDAAVMCGVLTRNIGVGCQYPNTRTTSTTTTFSVPDVIPTSCSSTQTEGQRLTDTYMQTVDLVKRTTNSGVTAKPDTSDCELQIGCQTRTIGVSNDTIKDTFCNQCNVLTRTVGSGPITQADTGSPISLKALSVPRSKSFTLGKEKLGLNALHRTVGCQSETFVVHQSTQYSPSILLNRFTDTSDLHPSTDAFCNTVVPPLIDASCNTATPLLSDAFSNTGTPLVSDVSCNTVTPILSNASCNTVTPILSNASCNTDEEVQSAENGGKKEDSGFTGSRIPRPFNSPSASSERVRLRRQDTYTKIPAVVINSGLSGIDLSPTEPATSISSVEPECTGFTKAKQSYNLSDISATPVQSSQTNNEDSSENKHIQPEELQPESECTSFNLLERASRSKAVPNKEMQGAMKVLNDFLQKSKFTGGTVTGAAKSHLKNALNIIQQEWFNVSSLVNADPLNVEDYLDQFEEISGTLLQYIVNMTDDSGNTAMHYAVSHGNLDVVSILLDSKVCNINKPNKAGYTSVMLVSLTELRSLTDATVVRRLFQLADVNVRAKQHGQTALMLAVSHGRLDMVQMLLEAGADINIQDEDGSTALMCAAEHGHIEIVKYFLSHPECDSSIVDVDGSTALKIALEAGHKDIGVLLYAHEHSVHGISPYSSLKQRKTKTSVSKSSSSASVSRSPSRSTLDNKNVK